MADYDSFDGWRRTRLDMIESHYGKDYFKGKTVLEVGAAWGHIGAYFQNELGAIVTCTDQYDGWVKIIQERHPTITAFVQNINESWPTDVHYDVLIHMGVLYHQPIEVAEIRLREAISICDEMILESDAEENSDPWYIRAIPKPPPEDWWEPIPTDYCCPSTAFVERILLESDMSFTRGQYSPTRFVWFCKKESI